MTDVQDIGSEEEVKESGNAQHPFKDRLGSMLNAGSESFDKWKNELDDPAGTTEVILGTALGCLTVRAFTKAWPRLRTPIIGMGYLVGGYAAYLLVKETLAYAPKGSETEGPIR